MDTSIDTLVIEIESSAKEAGGGIDSLISKLENLKVKVNENLKALGRLNSALIHLNANSHGISNLGDIGRISTPTASITPEIGDVDTSSAVQGLDEITGATTTASNAVSYLANQYDVLGNSGVASGSKIASALGVVSKGFSKLLSLTSMGIKTISKISGVVSKVGSFFGNFFNRIRGQGASSINSMGDAVSSLSKKLRMTTLALLGTRGAFTAIRKAVSAYMEYDTALAKTLQQDWAILGSLIAPILERIINLFSILVSYIATFIKMLTGVDLVARANKKSLGGVGSSAGKTAKQVKELSDELGNLQKFDDLNVVDFPKDSGGSGGAGGGGGAGGIEPLKLPDIDTSPIDKFWEYIKADRWYALGMDIAHAFNNAIRTIDFDYLIEKAREWGKNFADFFNGLRDGLDGALLGKQLAGALNTAFNFVDSFFTTYNFSRLGIKLADIFNSLIDNIQWDTLGRVITAKFRGAIETLFTFVDSFDFNALGSSLGDMLNSMISNIPWGELASGLSNGIQGLLDTITNLLTTLDVDSIVDSINEFFSNLDLGGLASSLSDTFITAFNTLGTVLSQVDWESLGQQIADFLINIDWSGLLTSVLNVVGGVLKGLGGVLWGFVKTLADDTWKKFTNWLNSTPLGKSLSDMFKEGFEMIKAVWNLVEPYFKGVFDAIKLVFEPIKDSLSNTFSTAWNMIKIVWNQASNFFKTIIDTITGIFSVVKSVLSGDFKGAWEAIKGIVGTWANFFKNTWNNIKNVFATVVTFFGNTFRNAVSAITNTFGAVLTFFSGIFASIKKIFTTIGGTIGNAIGKSFANVVNSIISFAEKTINGFIRAINKAIGLINEIPGVKVKKLTELSIPKLATGTNQIEVEGLYHLHQGEAVVPKKYNPAVNNKAYNENNEKMLRKMDDLLNLLNNMETTNNVYIGNEKVHKSTVRYINREQNIYGTTVV